MELTPGLSWSVASGYRWNRPGGTAAGASGTHDSLARRAVRTRQCQAGFTLLEILVAFAIAAIALGVLYRGAADGLLGTRLAVRSDEAVARARSRLAALCHGAPLMAGEQSGDDGGGYRWRTAVSRAETATIPQGGTDEATPASRVDLFAVRVTLSWPGPLRSHGVSLETRCLSVGAVDRP